MRPPRIPLLIAFFAAFLYSSSSFSSETDAIRDYRVIDGTGNNPSRPGAGISHSPLIRLAAPGYGDGTDLPRGVLLEDEGDGDIEIDEQALPSGRTISNVVHDQGDRDIPSKRRLNQLFFQFGQFLSHDTGLTEPDGSVATGGATGLSGNEKFPVQVVAGDPDFTFGEIPATRSISIAAGVSPTGFREQINVITAFIDGSNVYGENDSRADVLRSFVGGKLYTSAGPDGDLMPYNTWGLSYANPFHAPASSLFAGGDVRCNEQVGLIAFHVLFLREHNRLADEIAARDFPGADLSDPAVDEEIYQRARAVVGALLQKITYYEWLPALLGEGVLGDYLGYDPNVDPTISNEFSTAAFRIGHTMLPRGYDLVADDGTRTRLELIDAFFRPSFVAANGISPILRGQALAHQQQLDRFVVGEVRNFLFGPGFGGLDLASLNLQRGRDHGLASYNETREALGLPRRGHFLGVTGGDQAAAAALEAAYGTGRVDDVDLWTGGLCEPHLPWSTLGETFTAIFVEQFVRLRDGDRFYFENRDIYSDEFVNRIFATTLTDIVRRNTTIGNDELNGWAFFVPGYDPHQPDLRIGGERSLLTHRGDDVYNLTAARQRLATRHGRNRWGLSHLSLQNDGAYSGRIALRTNRLPVRRFRTLYHENRNSGRSNVTGRILAGNYLDDGSGVPTRIETRVRNTRRNVRSRATLRFIARSVVNSGAADANRWAAIFR